MKQLFISGNATNLFFSKEASFDDIFEWVQEKVMFNSEISTNIFNLNEQYSCSVNCCVGGICISGDEDYKVINIEDVKTIL